MAEARNHTYSTVSIRRSNKFIRRSTKCHLKFCTDAYFHEILYLKVNWKLDVAFKTGKKTAIHFVKMVKSS